MRENPNIVIVRADKGVFVSILDRSNYTNKIINQISNSGCYIKLKKNPLNSVSKIVATFVSQSSLKNFRLRKSYPPRIYGLPEIHKPGEPLRCTLNTTGGPNYLLAKFLALNLKPLVGHTNSFVNNYVSFFKEWSDVRVDPWYLLVSFDIVSLDTKKKFQEATNVIGWITTQSTIELVGLCLT